MIDESAEQREERKETGRLEALSDGIFAVAVTLLIFNVHVPDPSKLSSTGPLSLIFNSSAWLSMVTYVISFLTILVMWVNHHSIFQFVARIDRAFIYLNGGLLMLIVFVNYPTSLVAEFADTAGATLAAATYSATLVVMAIFYNALWLWAASGHRLLARDVNKDEVDRITYQYRFGPILYLVAFALAFVNPWLSIGLNAALAIYFAFTGQITRSHVRASLN
jgi:uncharacterized membrane protein